MKIKRIFAALAVFVFVGMVSSGCTTSSTSGTNIASDYAGNHGGVSGDRWIGVFIPMQSPATDRIASGQHANNYFMPLWNAYQSGSVQGGSAMVTAYLYKNGQTTWRWTGHVSGMEKRKLPGHLIDRDTSLCVSTPWKWIAHQKSAPVPGVMCADKIWRYMNSGRGRTAADAYGVVAIQPAG